MDLELNHRIGQASAAFQHLSRPLFTNRHLPLHLRLRFFNALVLSRLYFGLGARPPLKRRQEERLQGVATRFLRRLLRLKPDDFRLSLHTLLHRTGQDEIRVRIALDRLAYAQRVFTTAPAFVQHNLHRAFVLTESSWMHGLFADIDWLHQVLPQDVPAHWAHDLTEVIDLWQTDPGRWKALLKKGRKYHRYQSYMMGEVHGFHKQIFTILKSAGAAFDPSPDLLVTPDLERQCSCGKAFETHCGLCAHQRKAHHWYSLERRFLAGSVCPCCLKQMWSTQRLQQYLAYLPRGQQVNPCYQAPAAAGISLQYEKVELPKQFGGQERCDAVQLQGPGIELPDLRGRQCAQQ